MLCLVTSTRQKNLQIGLYFWRQPHLLVDSLFDLFHAHINCIPCQFVRIQAYLLTVGCESDCCILQISFVAPDLSLLLVRVQVLLLQSLDLHLRPLLLSASASLLQSERPSATKHRTQSGFEAASLCLPSLRTVSGPPAPVSSGAFTRCSLLLGIVSVQHSLSYCLPLLEQ